MKNRWKYLLLILACALVAAPAGASLFVALSQDELVAKSDLVVIGRVVETRSFWNPEGTMVLTEAVVEVDESLAGRAPVQVIVQSIGGEIDGRRYEAVGVPALREGERLLLFLSRADRSTFRVAGYSQGQFGIVKGAEGEEMAVSKVQAGTLVGQGGRLVGPPASVRLDVFKEQIRERVARRGSHVR